MVYLSTWDEFQKAVESLYFSDPLKCRLVMKYRNKNGIILKMTNDQVCYKFRTEYAQDIKKMEKLMSQLMRHMASKEA